MAGVRGWSVIGPAYPPRKRRSGDRTTVSHCQWNCAIEIRLLDQLGRGARRAPPGGRSRRRGRRFGAQFRHTVTDGQQHRRFGNRAETAARRQLDPGVPGDSPRQASPIRRAATVGHASRRLRARHRVPAVDPPCRAPASGPNPGELGERPRDERRRGRRRTRRAARHATAPPSGYRRIVSGTGPGARRRSRCHARSQERDRAMPVNACRGGRAEWIPSSHDRVSAAAHRPTLMTVHAHPDDETIGTGGTMATSVRAGRRVVLVTCTRGEMGEIVVPDMDTPDNHRRLGEIRAGELERAMDAPRRHRVGEPRLPRLGHDGPHGEPRRALLLAGEPRRGHRPARVPRPDLPARRHDDVQRLRRLRPPGPHPDPPGRGRRVRPGRRPRLVPGAARARARRDRRPGGRGRARAVDPGQALRAGDPGLGAGRDARADGGDRRAELLVGARGRVARAAHRVGDARRRGCSSRTSPSRPGST